MELVGILKVLWRRRLITISGAVLAIALGIVSSYQVSLMPPTIQSRDMGSVAVGRVLVDTPRSLLARPHPSGAETISTRAALLGELLASDEAKEQIADQAGVASSTLGVLGPDSTEPAAVTQLSQAASRAARPAVPHVITVEADPIVSTLSIVAEAPDADAARRLANAASGAIDFLVRSAGPARGDRASIQPLGEPATEVAPGGQGPGRAGLVALMVSVLWSLAVVALDGIATRRLNRAPAPSASPSASAP